MPREPDTRPSGKPLPKKPAQTETLCTGASGKQPDRTQPTPSGSRQASTPNQSGWSSTSGQSGTTTTPGAEGCPLPTRVVDWPPPAGARPKQPQEVLPTTPRVEEEQVMVPEPTGTKCTCARPRVGSLNPQRLRTQLGWQKQGKRPLVTFMTEWSEKNHPRVTSPLGPCGPTTLELTHKP